jgi:hypothetical protein
MRRPTYRYAGLLTFACVTLLPLTAWSAELHTSLITVTDTQQVACVVSNVGSKTMDVFGEVVTGSTPPTTLNSATLTLDSGESMGIGISTPEFSTPVRCSLSFKGKASEIRAVLRSFEVTDIHTTIERAEAR